MQRKRFTEELIAFRLRQLDSGTPVTPVGSKALGGIFVDDQS